MPYLFFLTAHTLDLAKMVVRAFVYLLRKEGTINLVLKTLGWKQDTLHLFLTEQINEDLI